MEYSQAPTPQLEHFEMITDGKAAGAASGRTYKSENPYLGQPWAVVPDGGVEDVDTAVAAARAAGAGPWSRMTGFERVSGLGRENGLDAINEYLENKSVWVELSGGTRDRFTLG